MLADSLYKRKSVTFTKIYQFLVFHSGFKKPSQYMKTKKEKLQRVIRRA